jgi:hypothetical protein
MPLPEAIRVKLSSEAAEYVSLTPVVVREMPTRELVELMLGLTGKDVGRIHELLLRGTLVSGASRFRWPGWDADPASIQAALDTFPDPDPSRPFSSDLCVRVVLKGAGSRIDLPREIAAQRRLFRGKSYWDVLMAFAAGVAARYIDYSYRERADCYIAEVLPGAALELRRNARLMKYSSIEGQIRGAALEAVELYVRRP